MTAHIKISKYKSKGAKNQDPAPPRKAAGRAWSQLLGKTLAAMQVFMMNFMMVFMIDEDGFHVGFCDKKSPIFSGLTTGLLALNEQSRSQSVWSPR